MMEDACSVLGSSLQKSLMHRLNSYLFCAATETAVTFWQKAALAKFSNRHAPLSSLIVSTTALGCLISVYVFIKLNSGGHLQAQADLNVVTHPNFGRFAELSGVLNVCQGAKSYFI